MFILYYHQQLFLPKGNEYMRQPNEARDTNKYRAGRFLKEEENKQTKEPSIREMTYSKVVKKVSQNVKDRLQARAKERLQAGSGDDEEEED